MRSQHELAQNLLAGRIEAMDCSAYAGSFAALISDSEVEEGK